MFHFPQAKLFFLLILQLVGFSSILASQRHSSVSTDPSEVRLQINKVQEVTSHVFLFIHGLGMDPRQFRHQVDLVSQLGFNSVSVTLSGHSYDAFRAEQIKTSDWHEDVKRGIRKSLELGEKVILVGHSTGGILALAHSTFHSRISRMILVEPALRVRFFARNGSCLNSRLNISTTEPLIRLSRQFGIFRRTFREGVPTINNHLGCLVNSLRHELLQEYGIPQGTELEKTRELALRIHTPLLMLINPDDQIVDPENSIEFCEIMRSRGLATCQLISEDDVHGTILDEDHKSQELNEIILNYLRQT